MRARLAALLVFAAILSSVAIVVGPAALAASSNVVLAQQSEDSTDNEGSDGESGATDGGEGSGRPDAEVGANQGQTQTGGAEETGPPWTYQMARIIVAMLLLMALAIGLMYWRLVVQRQRHGI